VASRPYIDIPFGPYLPDLGGIPNPGMPGYLVDAVGVRSTPNGYRGLPVFADVSSATAIGAVGIEYTNAAAYYTASTISFFVVTEDGPIFESRAEGTDTWENVSPAPENLTPFGDFIRFGDDVIYVCSARAPIFKDLTASHATDFAALAGSPPTASCGARVRRHVVLGNLSTDGYAVRTSAIGNHEDWPTPGTQDARSKQTITESLNPEFGFVKWVLGGEKFGIIVQDHALTRMTYVGGTSVFEFDTYERFAGSGYSSFYSRPVTDGKLWYWYNETGFYATDGYSVTRLSEGKIGEALFTNTISHPIGSSGMVPAFSSVYDSRRGLVIFGNNAYSGATTYQLVYNVNDGNFSLMSETTRTSFFSGHKTSSTRTLNGRMVYNINASNRKLQRLSESGTPTIAMQTGYLEIDPGYRVQLQGAHVLGTGTGSLTLAYKTAATSAACDVLQSGFTSMTAAGLGQKKTARDSAQYIAFRITGTGAESQLIKGIRIYYERAEPSP
jgi:hypothetical protein